MTILKRVYLLVCIASLMTAVTSGCGVATAVADSKQVPPSSTFASKKSADRMFTAATQAMGAFGKVTSSDRTSGVVQGQKGNWTMSAGVTASGAGSRIDLSARYVPSRQYDFYSRDALTAEYLALVEKNLGEKLALVSP